MSDTEFDIIVAAYTAPSRAEQDFNGLLKLVEGKEVQVEGVVLASKDDAGQVTVKETGDHLGRRGAAIGGGVGLVVGLFSPALLASVLVGGAAGGLAGKFARHRVEKGIEKKIEASLPAGLAGVVAIYDCSKADTVDASLAGAVKKSVAQVDGRGAKQLKAAFAEAGQGLKS